MVDTYLNLNTFDVGPKCWDLKTFKKSCSDNADVFFTETVQALPGGLVCCAFDFRGFKYRLLQLDVM